MDDSDEADPDASVSPRRVLASGAKPDEMARLPVGLAFGWLFLTVLLGVGQASRIIRFRGRLRAAVPAPDDLVEEAERIGRCLGVRVPELLVVPDLGTPLLWCLGRPKLLLPAQLVKTLDLDRWRGILTHELAHLRRGDHWVSRLELAAGLIWWWNPVYWLARTRLDAEAELACDAWVVSTLPKDRLAYAEALLRYLFNLVHGQGAGARVGCRRLGPILREEIDHDPARSRSLPALPPGSPGRVPPGLVRPALLVDGQTGREPERRDRRRRLSSRPSIRSPPPPSTMTMTMTTTTTMTTMTKPTDRRRPRPTSRRPRLPSRRSRPTPRRPRPTPRRPRPTQKDKAKEEVECRLFQARREIEKEIEGKFGPDFEKKMEELGEKIEKEIEGKFGPDFEKKMEELGEKIGKEMEAKLGPGSDFEKKMKELGKEMEAKFGPGSDFEKKMKELGKEMEAKFGPGSDFEKKMKELGKEMEAKFGPGSDFEKKVAEDALKRAQDRLEWARKMHEKGYVSKSQKDAEEAALAKARSALRRKPGPRRLPQVRSTSEAPKTASAKGTAKAPAASQVRQRERRIAALELADPQTRRRVEGPQADDDPGLSDARPSRIRARSRPGAGMDACPAPPARIARQKRIQPHGHDRDDRKAAIDAGHSTSASAPMRDSPISVTFQAFSR